MATGERKASRTELIGLLLAAGFGIGLVFPLSKLAAATGISPFTYIGFSALGASATLLVLAWLEGSPVRATAVNLRYATIAGALTYAIPFGVLTLVVTHVGTGIPAVLQSLTPMLTLLLVSILRADQLGGHRIVGLSLGLVGVLMIIVQRNTLAAEEGSGFWLAAAFVTPLALSCGNVYRSRAWPAGEKPVVLATLTFAAAAALMLGAEDATLATAGPLTSLTALLDALPVIAAQSIASGFGYYFFFRLQ